MIKHFVFQYYLLIAGVACIIIVAFAVVAHSYRNWELIITILGGALTFMYLVQKQKSEELRLFKELFTDFNKRYDGLNERLNHIAQGNPNQPLTSEEIDTLNDYFNLCGEEYLFYKQQYIYPEVWQAWVNGMKIFYNNERIKALWKKELETGSYYGLKFE